nr:MAG TPA: hypothetical protein [Caudoviricetes sp.]
MDPQQELFTYFVIKLKEEYGEDMVFDGFMPPEETPYPFIYLADSQQTDDYGNKTAIFNNVYQAIHIWNDTPRKRGTVSNMALKIKNIARRLEYTNNYKWEIKDIKQRILVDTTKQKSLVDTADSTPLMHVILELEFKSSSKGGKRSDQ